jgi:hydrogenase/urease accessory protein HupE
VDGHRVKPGTAAVRGPVVTVVTLAAVLSPRPASAHLVTTGLGPVYDGISHVLVSPDDLVPILAIAFLAGLNGPAAGRSALFALTGAWLAGGVLGLLSASPLLPPAITVVTFLLVGSLVAMDHRLSPRVVAALAAAVGLLHGWLNGVSLAQAQREGSGLLGVATAAFVIAAIASARVASLRAPWTRIAVRVVGGWVTAIGLLMLGWSLRAPL